MSLDLTFMIRIYTSVSKWTHLHISVVAADSLRHFCVADMKDYLPNGTCQQSADNSSIN